jgi:hypothetical protein
MIIHKYSNEDDWKTGRLGKVTGTRLKDLIVKRGTKPKKGFYEIIAERVALPPTEENVMERGKRLELDAIERFEQETGKKANSDLILITRDDNEYIAYSPDGIIGDTETIEVKCLNSASHIEAWVTKKIPSEYDEQVIQPFVVNDKLETLYFVFYDPRMPIDFFFFTVTREELADKITKAYETQLLALAQIAEIEAQLTF